MSKPAASSGTSAPATIGVIGTGLIGTSIIAQLLGKGPACHIRALETNSMHKTQISKLFETVQFVETIEALANCDVVFVCTPVSYIAAYLIKLADILAPEAIVIDTGSTKSAIIAEVCAALPEYQGFVPGHPMAGSHLTGPKTATENVLQGKPFVLTPYAQTAVVALEKATAILNGAGFNTIIANAEAHDEILALTSHLPHLISFAMVSQFAKFELDTDMTDLIAGSFKRMTIHAASDAKMWCDIFASNRQDMLKAIKGFRQQLDTYEKLITEQDDAALMTLIKSGQQHVKELD